MKPELTGKGWEVVCYNKDGDRRRIVEVSCELDAAKCWRDEVICGYPHPTVWKNGKRIPGY